MNPVEVQVLYSINEIDPGSWDCIGQGNPFTSHRWHRFGEAALAHDRPFYALVRHQNQSVAYSVFWLARQEPLPIASPTGRRLLQTLFQRWPLLICRAPLAHVPGIVLPDTLLRQPALNTLCEN